MHFYERRLEADLRDLRVSYRSIHGDQIIVKSVQRTNSV